MLNLVKIVLSVTLYYAEFGFEMEVCRHFLVSLQKLCKFYLKKKKKIFTQYSKAVYSSNSRHTLVTTVVDTSPKWWLRGNISGLVSWKKKKKARNVATSPAGEASATTDKSRAPAPREMEDTTTTVQLGSCSHRHVSPAKPLFYCETSWQVCAALMWCMSRFLAVFRLALK